MTTNNTGEESGSNTQEITTEQTDTPKTFTQDEVNAMMGKVRSDTNAKFSDYDTLKERAKVADQLETDKLSAQEKAEKRAVDAERRVIDSDARVASGAIYAEVKVLATQMGFIDPNEAYALVDQTAFRYEDGVGVTGVTEALEALLTKSPHLKGSTTPPAPNLNRNERTPAPATAPLTDAERQMAHRLFRNKTPAEAEAEYAAGKTR